MEYEEESSSKEIMAFIENLCQVHCDNAKASYYVSNGRRRNAMAPITPFIHEFFLFNSLYSVNWEKSKKYGEVCGFEDENEENEKCDKCGGSKKTSYSESKKIRELINFCKNSTSGNPAILYRSFAPLLDMDLSGGDWITIATGTRISQRDGQHFFQHIQEIFQLLEDCQSPSEMTVSKKFFEPLRKVVFFVFNVRNNIFHGSKNLMQIWDINQRRRIELYDLILKCVNSMFFLTMNQEKAACDYIACPIQNNVLPLKFLQQSDILQLTNDGLMKFGDARLITQFFKQIPQLCQNLKPSDTKAALFYPSSGEDILTPLLLGLPYCTDFFFFKLQNRSPRQNRRPTLSILSRSLRRILDIPQRSLQRNNNKQNLNRLAWEESGDRSTLRFDFNDIPRTIHLYYTDNTNFLKEDMELRFYFHRGDSWGEGGSGQEWDSKMIPKLKKMIPKEGNCFFLTDGEPGGFDDTEAHSCFEFPFRFIERGRPYYCGQL